MKRILQILIVLFVFYYIIQIVFHFIDKGYEITYELNAENKKFDITEIYTANQKNEQDNYYLEISVENTKFYVKIYENLRKSKNIIKEIKYIDSGNYKCVLPIFKDDKILTDIICKNSQLTTNYQNIKGIDVNIDAFANNIEGYNDKFVDSANESSNRDNIYIYEDNIIDELFLGLTSYNGLYNINNLLSKSIAEIDVFNDDVYSSKINTQIKNFYLVANYNSNYEFTKFYLINLLTKEYDEIDSKNKISFNSYIQGTVGNSVYLIDIDNKKQYEIDVKTKKVIEVGNENSGVKTYNSGTWENKPIVQALQTELKFTENNIDAQIFSKQYYRIDKVGGENSGYYYLYENTDNGYNVYKAYTEQPNEPILLLKINDINRIKYVNNQIIYIDKNIVKIYNEQNGIKRLIRYDELEFNKNLNIFAYYKD